MTNPRSEGSPKARARAKTEQMRVERAKAQARQERNQRLMMIVGALVAVGLVAAIVWAIVDSAGGGSGETKPRSDGNDVPANVDGYAMPVGEEDAPVTLDLYFDYMCPACGAFEQLNGADLDKLVEDGDLKVNLRTMNFLDGTSEGTQFSTRAGNAVATVANESPELVWDFHRALFENQPQEGTRGLSDDDLVDIATEAGVSQEIADTFADGTYDNWVVKSNEAANSDGVESTPTLKINGETFEGNWQEPGAVLQAIQAAEAG